VNRKTPVGVATLAYALASLAHHVHNAEWLDAYPNLPAGLTRAVVYAAWAAVTVVGASGYLLYRGRHVRTGLALLAVYAALGFYGLAHYAVAPVAAHSLAMNLTIGCEVATAALLAVCVAREVRRQFRVNEISGT
jgi:hypothetical protein